MFPGFRALCSQDPKFPGPYVSTFYSPMVPRPKVPRTLCSQVLESHVPMILCSQGPILPGSGIRSQLGISDWEHRYTCLNSALTPPFILFPSVLVFPPNQSLVSLPASSLPPPSILVFILASQSVQTGRPLALQSIIIVVFDTYNLRQKNTLSAPRSFSLSAPHSHLFLSLLVTCFFLSGCQMLASSTFAPHPLPLPALAESTPHLSIHFLSPFSTPLP